MGLRQKPKQEYRQAEAPATDGQLDGLLNVVDNEKELTNKAEELRNQIQQLERTRETVDNSITYLKEVQKQLSETLKAFNAAEGSADNIINGIVAQICKVEHTRFTAHLDEASVSLVQETNTKVIEHKKEVLEAHFKKEADMWNSQASKMRSILSQNEGVWISSKLFYIVAPIALLSMLIVLLYILLWVYFNWIA